MSAAAIILQSRWFEPTRNFLARGNRKWHSGLFVRRVGAERVRNRSTLFRAAQYSRLRGRHSRNNKAPAISRARRNRARIVVSYKTFAILREVWLTCNNLSAAAGGGSGCYFRRPSPSMYPLIPSARDGRRGFTRIDSLSPLLAN